MIALKTNSLLGNVSFHIVLSGDIVRCTVVQWVEEGSIHSWVDPTLGCLLSIFWKGGFNSRHSVESIPSHQNNIVEEKLAII